MVAGGREQIMGERDRVDDGVADMGHPLPLQGGVDEADVEARVMGDEDVVAEELEDLGKDFPDRRGGFQILGVDAVLL